MKILIAILATVICFRAGAEEAPLEAPYTRPPDTSSEHVVIEKPERISDDGEYFYGGATHAKDKYYKLDPLPPFKSAIFLHFGTIGPFAVSGDNGKTYKDVYDDKAGFLIGFEYERFLGNLAGKWSWKLNSGLSTAEGKGSFAHPNGYEPKEKFTFFVFPNTATVSYKLNFSNTQWFTPYVDAGAGYFTFVEYRDDGHKTAFGGAPVLTGAAGLLFSLSAIDQVAKATMFEDYDVKHLWLDLQFRRIEGLDKKKDFSSNMISGGFGFAF